MLQAMYPVSTSIAQSGEVPSDARSIQMRINAFYGYALSVTFAGHDIPMFFLRQNTPSDFTVGGDISAYDGQTGELRLTSTGSANGDRWPGFEIDAITLSSQEIPEPSAALVILLGGTVIAVTCPGVLCRTNHFTRRRDDDPV